MPAGHGIPTFFKILGTITFSFEIEKLSDASNLSFLLTYILSSYFHKIRTTSFYDSIRSSRGLKIYV